MKNPLILKKLIRNPFFIFLPFLFYYSYLIVKSKWPSLYGDEVRYYNFAINLIHGFYSPPAPHISLWNGPGFPIILMPFVALTIYPLYITLMNALYFYLAVVFLFKALRLIADYKTALILSLLLAVYPNALSMLPILYTEAFTNLLVSALVYTVALYYNKGNKKYGIIAGLILGYLVLTKIIFGYVVVICLGIFFINLLFKKNKAYYFKPIRILLIAFAVTVPYLAYTWQLTGKLFYWGNSGGMSLYWMSTPYPHEYGDWKVPYLTNKQYPTLFKSAEVVTILKKNHQKDIADVLKHKDNIEQDEAYKQLAIQNIKNHPLKFMGNCIDNFSRMLFNFPYSYSFQDDSILRGIIIGYTMGVGIGHWVNLAQLAQNNLCCKVFIITYRGLSFIERCIKCLPAAIGHYSARVTFLVRLFNCKYQKAKL
ncbi:dolichyl-phosphate-mannose-protein mannosyltransferase [Mucilaginibacter gracilis]|uniref:Dolichyl-phosphate-mannose-protein mannosyltransferase n=1 Tax=Mucilaginibacter gracilis TaxID=423350 RepID=A0A495JAE5_9SPHI|nr:glycosyltransferase family 39 protein [Mucilaginibacter gracilis]RKR85681.1 dolichyl-phosphate-mannose-protein mannosyltransferase [Mucilaginibacter gracilis]